jgi:pimeloyl-ACP methyl ester carboxylesterase
MGWGLRALAGLAVAAAVLAGAAEAKPPLTAFVEVADVRSMSLSPNGTQLAWIQKIDGVDYVLTRPLAGGAPKALTKTADGDTNQVTYLTDKYLMLIASNVSFYYGSPGKLRFGRAFIHNLEKTSTYGLDATGEILAVSDDGERMYQVGHGYFGGSRPAEMLLSNGNPWNTDLGAHMKESYWIVSPKGKIVLAEEFSAKDGVHKLYALDGSMRRQVFEETGKLPQVQPVGMTPDRQDIVVVDSRDKERATLHRLSLKDGTIGPALFTTDRGEAANPVLDTQGLVQGVMISGTYPSYQFFDASLTEDMKRATASFRGKAVWLQSWSKDWRKLILLVVGGGEAGRYMLFDRDARKFISLMSARPGLAAGDVGETVSIEYKARDGLTIPAVMTWPAGSTPETRKSLPLVVLPHGGPESYDSVRYDPTAQFLANEGYAVLQPNFRGSSGFGTGFRLAGKRQFGRKMQDDVTDGVAALVEMGWADPKRVCIMGFSYGGYSALAGGALTPDLYKCVISVAGVSDLPEMLKYVSDRYGGYSSSVAYWSEFLGNREADAAELRQWSPTSMAAAFKAPVLLLHGENDLTSPPRQSELMERALKGASKDVAFIKLPDEGHNLQQDVNLSRVYAETGRFLAQHLGGR